MMIAALTVRERFASDEPHDGSIRIEETDLEIHARQMLRVRDQNLEIQKATVNSPSL
jgi:hypothetical protein